MKPREVLLFGLLMIIIMLCVNERNCFELRRSDDHTCSNVRSAISHSGLADPSLVPRNPVLTASLEVCERPDLAGRFTCCNRAIEEGFLRTAREELTDRLNRHNEPLLRFLTRRTDQLKDNLRNIVQRAETSTVQKLRSSFIQIAYKLETMTAISDLFAKLRHFSGLSEPEKNYDRRNFLNLENFDALKKEIRKSVMEFFSELFPPVFSCVATLSDGHICAGDELLAPQEYLRCLKENALSFQAFGSLPRTLAEDISEAVVKFRLAYSSLGLLSDLANSTNDWSAECLHAFARMRYCSLCQEQMIDHFEPVTRPSVCDGLCVNVLTGCLRQEARLHWPEIVEKLVGFGQEKRLWDPRNLRFFERLGDLDSGRVMENFHKGTENAIMDLIERRKNSDVARMVLRKCGKKPNNSYRSQAERRIGHLRQQKPPMYRVSVVNKRQSDKGNNSQQRPVAAFWSAFRESARILETSFANWWRESPRSLCRLAPDSGEPCWTGVSIGRYAKPVVSLEDSKNPEVQAFGKSTDSRNKTSDAENVDLTTKVKNLKKLIAFQEKTDERGSPGEQNSMLVRSTDARVQYPDLQNPDGRRPSDWTLDKPVVEGSGWEENGDYFPESDDEDHIAWYGDTPEEGSGSGTEFDWEDERSDDGLRPMQGKPTGMKPVWPEHTRDGPTTFKTSEEHPDDLKKTDTKSTSATKGACRSACARTLSALTLITMVISRMMGHF